MCETMCAVGYKLGARKAYVSFILVICQAIQGVAVGDRTYMIY